MKKKIILLFLIAIFVFGTFAGCTSEKAEETPKTATTDKPVATEAVKEEATETDGEVKLEGKIIMATNRTDKVDNVLTEMAQEFMDIHPDVTVEIEGLKDIENILSTRMAAGELPDVTPVLKTVVKEDYPLYYLPIDDLGYTVDDVHFYEEGVSVDGKLYALSSGVSYNGITYSKIAFKKAGIEKVPTTTEDLYAACEKLKAVDVIPLATVYKSKWPLNWWLNDLYYQVSMSGNENYRTKMTEMDAIAVEGNEIMSAFELLRDMNANGYLEPDLMSSSWDTTGSEHAKGNIGMIFLGTWYPPQVVEQGANPDDIGMFPVPGSKCLVQGSDWSFAVSKNSKNPEVAKAFLKFMMDDGKYADAVSIIAPLKNITPDAPGVEELLSFGLPMVPNNQDSLFLEIKNKAEIDFSVFLQEYIVSDNPDKVIETLNEKWAEARKKVIGE